MPGLGAARVAVGDDAVGDLDAGVGHRRDRAREPEVDVVGMRGHDEDPFDAVESSSSCITIARDAIACDRLAVRGPRARGPARRRRPAPGRSPRSCSARPTIDEIRAPTPASTRAPPARRCSGSSTPASWCAATTARSTCSVRRSRSRRAPRPNARPRSTEHDDEPEDVGRGAARVRARRPARCRSRRCTRKRARRARLAGAALRAGPALLGADGEPHHSARCIPTPRRCAAISSTKASSIAEHGEYWRSGRHVRPGVDASDTVRAMAARHCSIATSVRT